MKPFNRNKLLPHMSPRKEDQETPLQSPHYGQLAQHILKMQTFLEGAYSHASIQQAQLIESQQTQTDLLKEVVHLLNKSIKIQSAAYKVEKQVAKQIGKMEEDQLKSILTEDKRVDQSIVEESKHLKEDSGAKEIIEVTQFQNTQIQTEDTSKFREHHQSSKDTQLSLAANETIRNSWNDYKETIIQVPFDHLLNIKIQEPSQFLQTLQKPLRVFISGILKSISESAFYGYYSAKSISEQESKALFSRNLVLNFFEMINGLRLNYNELWKSKSNQILSYFNKELKKTMGYFKLKYPQKKKAYLRPQLNNLIPSFDNTQEYDTFIFSQFKNLNQISLGWNVKETTWREIKLFLNFLIRETKEKYNQFYSSMRGLFTYYSKMHTERGSYSEENYIQHEIGSKLPIMMPEYSNEDLDKEGLNIKAPQMMRVVIKWIEGLEDTIRDCEAKPIDYFKKTEDQLRYVQLPKNMSFKQYQLQDARATKLKIMSDLNEFKKSLEEKKASTEESYLNHIQSLIPQTLERYQSSFPAVPNTDIKIGLFSSVVSQSISGITERYLYKLIDKLSSFKREKNLPFEVFDLFRAKCSGTSEQIKEVYKRLLESNGNFNVIRVKNRLNTGNRDFLVNFTMKDSNLICQLQLHISEAENTEKQEYYDHFNHFLYELERSKYGAICEAVNIVSSIEDHFSFFSTNKMNQLSNKISKKSDKPKYQIRIEKEKIVMEGFDIVPSEFDFICNNCFQFKKMFTSFLPIGKAKDSGEIGNMICGKCLIEMLPHEDISLFLLNAKTRSAFHYISYEELLEQKPKYFVLIREGPEKRGYGYKLYKENTYVKCMFGVDNDQWNLEVEKKQIALDDKGFFNDMFIFVLKKSEDVEMLRIETAEDLSPININQLESYRILSTKKRDHSYYQSVTKEYLLQHDTTILIASKYAFILDIQPKNFQEKILQFGDEKTYKQLANIFKNTGQGNWDLVGDYTTNLFQHLSPIMGNCKILYSQLSKMKELPHLEMINLEKCKMKIDLPSNIQLAALKMPQLAELQFELNESEMDLAWSNFPKLKKFKVKGKKIKELDFKGIKWPEVESLTVEAEELEKLKGFEGSILTFQLPKIKQLDVNTNCLEIDLSKFQTKEMSAFKVKNKGITLYPPFQSVKNIQISGPKIDFKTITGPTETLMLMDVPNINDVSDLPQPDKLKNLFITGSIASRLDLNATYSSLQVFGISNSFIEQLNFNGEFQKLIHLIASQTKLKTLDLTKFEKLQELRINANCLTNVKLRNEEQLNSLNSIHFEFNFYSPDFFNGITFKNYENQLWSDYGFEERQGENFKAPFIITKLTQEEFNDFMEIVRNNFPNVPPFTQDDIIMGKQDLEFLGEFKVDYQKWKTTADIIKQEKAFIKQIRKFNFEEQETTNSFYKWT